MLGSDTSLMLLADDSKPSLDFALGHRELGRVERI